MAKSDITKLKSPSQKRISKEIFKNLLSSRASSLRTTADILLKARNIRHSGTVVEDFIKDLFTQMFSSRFRVTSGYVVSRSSKQDFLVSPEVDLIILDTLVPNILFAQQEFIGKTEFVPKEAVVGIFQIKKTLNSGTIKNSLVNINNIINNVNILRNNIKHYNLGGSPTFNETRVSYDPRSREGLSPYSVPIETNIFANPILGIIELEQEGKEKATKNQLSIISAEHSIDIVFSFDGFLYVRNPPSPNPETRKTHYYPDNKIQDNVVTALGCITHYLYQTTGTIFSIRDYYL